MKRIGLFLIVMCAVSCGSAWADVTVVEGPTEIPFESGGVTPSGEVNLWLWGTEELVNEDYVGYIGTSPLSGADSSGDASLGGEVGLWYAEGNVDLGSNAATPTAFGRSVVGALVHFSIDGSQLSLHWNCEATTVTSYATWIVWVADDVLGGVGWYYAGFGTGERTEILDLEPIRITLELPTYSKATVPLNMP